MQFINYYNTTPYFKGNLANIKNECRPLTAINYKRKIYIIFQKVQRAASKDPKSRDLATLGLA